MMRVLFQFKSFAMASTQKTLIAGLQAGDARAVQGMIAMLGLGTLTTYLQGLADYGGNRWKQMQNGDTRWWVSHSIAASGLLGSFQTAFDIVDTFTHGRGRFDPGSMFTPPAVDTALDALNMLKSLKEPTQSTTHQIRQLIPFQNLSYLQALFTQVEKAANSFFGVPKKRESQRTAREPAL